MAFPLPYWSIVSVHSLCLCITSDDLTLRYGVFRNFWKNYKSGDKAYIPQQNGFTSGRSTLNNLVYPMLLVSSFINGCQVVSIYTDFANAFDRVSHSLLLLKPSATGFRSCFLDWIGSFLSNRLQCLRICESLTYVISGVPVFHIGPTNIHIIINDLNYNINKHF